MKGNCKSCKFSTVAGLRDPAAQAGTVRPSLQCRINPPQVFAFMAPTQNGATVANVSAWPSVGDNDTCGKWETGVEIALGSAPETLNARANAGY